MADIRDLIVSVVMVTIVMCALLPSALSRELSKLSRKYNPPPPPPPTSKVGNEDFPDKLSNSNFQAGENYPVLLV